MFSHIFSCLFNSYQNNLGLNRHVYKIAYCSLFNDTKLFTWNVHPISLSLYIYIFIYKCVCVCVYIYIYIYKCVCVSIYIGVYKTQAIISLSVFVRLCMPLFRAVSVGVCACACACVCVREYEYICFSCINIGQKCIDILAPKINTLRLDSMFVCLFISICPSILSPLTWCWWILHLWRGKSPSMNILDMTVNSIWSRGISHGYLGNME